MIENETVDFDFQLMPGKMVLIPTRNSEISQVCLTPIINGSLNGSLKNLNAKPRDFEGRGLIRPPKSESSKMIM